MIREFFYLQKSDRKVILVLLSVVVIALGIIFLTGGENETSNALVSADSIDNTPRVLPYKLALSLPLKEIYVTSPFGRRNDPIRKGSRQVHSGIDLKARFEPVYSMLPGMVTTTSYSIGGGYYVTVDYGMFSCSFLHLSRIDVLEGQRVRAGQRIAISGNTGKRTTGPHLHLSCKWNDTGKYFDPKVLLDMIRYDKHL